MLRHLSWIIPGRDARQLSVAHFGGLDILTAILSARHVEPWFYYAIVATAGSVIGAYMTFKAARKAGASYLSANLESSGLANCWRVLRNTAPAHSWCQPVPFPFPTSFFLRPQGVELLIGRFIAVVAICRERAIGDCDRCVIIWTTLRSCFATSRRVLPVAAGSRDGHRCGDYCDRDVAEARGRGLNRGQLPAPNYTALINYAAFDSSQTR
jgi:hypothetical protein